jgi:hypothetical protein
MIAGTRRGNGSGRGEEKGEREGRTTRIESRFLTFVKTRSEFLFRTSFVFILILPELARFTTKHLQKLYERVAVPTDTLRPCLIVQ